MAAPDGSGTDETPAPRPRYALTPGIAWLDGEEMGLTQPIVYVAPTTVDPPLVLNGPGWAVWTALAEVGGTLDEVTRTAAELAGADPADISADVAAFLRLLTEAGAVAAHEDVA